MLRDAPCMGKHTHIKAHARVYDHKMCPINLPGRVPNGSRISDVQKRMLCRVATSSGQYLEDCAKDSV